MLLHDNLFDIVCLNETWLNLSWNDSELNIEGYNLIRFDRTSLQRGGGARLYHRVLHKGLTRRKKRNAGW